jgi:dTDP-4-dehydrorhamnose 3,5-epimerase
VEFVPLRIEGVLALKQTNYEDNRGKLIRVWDQNDLMSDFSLNQCSIVSNPSAGTLRGIHYQTDPYSERKIVQCFTGKVFDVVVDLREDSISFGDYVSLEIGPSSNFIGLVVPNGCAHGYLTLEPDSKLIYFMDKEYSPQNSCGLLWNDPKLAIDWPMHPTSISPRDASWPRMI